MATVGDERTWLVVLRGNSGSGKSTTAKELRNRLGREVAWVEQDHLRRVLLRERDVRGGLNIGLIDQTVRYCLDNNYGVIVEGILNADRYGEMLERLTLDHAGLTRHFYFDIPLDETFARHASRAMAQEFSEEQMRDWYRERDLLVNVSQQIIGAESSLQQTVTSILESGIRVGG